MLKIGKGLKKKKKNKKGKKDQELFTEEELEQYRKQKAQKEAEAAQAELEAGEGTSDEPQPVNKSEEFEKFKLLTAGVDNILKKSQGDLDRIKKDSFFQRKPTPSELKALEEKERAEREKSEGNWVGFEEGAKGKVQTEEKGDESHFEDSGSEYEYEDNDDIFDTTYVDAVESGEIKLAYVPDDDELGFDDGPDPFDTTTADELLKRAEEEERKKKKEISLGLAVNVLTGRAERDKALLEGSDVKENKDVRQVRARPRKIQDLCLLGSFDESSKPEVAAVPASASPPPVEVPKSLLDDDLEIVDELPEGETLITQVLVKQAAPLDSELFEVGGNLNDIVDEFDLGPPVDLELKKLEEEDEFDEFSALAASSVANQKLEEELQQFEAAEDDPFDTSAVDTVLRSTPDPFASVEDDSKHLPVQVVAQIAPQGWDSFNDPVEVDPFDTSFADNCAPGKAELRLIEKEILAAPVVQSVAKKVDIHLEARILSRNNSEDFNPREGEEKVRNQRQRVSIQITNPSGETQRGSESEEIVALSLSHRDLLGGSTTDLSSVGDEPLAPSTTSPGEELSRYADPFDTSVADQVWAPGKVELKFIEKELLSDIQEVKDLSDDDFDPREIEKGNKGVSFDIPSPADLLSSIKEDAGARPLTPYYAEPISAESDIDLDDPFDTSHVTHLPGKQELKLIEQELDQISSNPVFPQSVEEKLGIHPEAVVRTVLKSSASDQDFNPRADEEQLTVENSSTRRFSDVSGLQSHTPRTLSLRSSFSEEKPDLFAVEEDLPVKPLTPALEEDLSGYVDPFDTSIAENIAPGKAELKVLEVELVGSQSYTDPDFNPRNETVSEGKLKTVPGTTPLAPLEVKETEPEDIDPFDTSIANNIAPSKAELRLLESEFVGQ